MFPMSRLDVLGVSYRTFWAFCDLEAKCRYFEPVDFVGEVGSQFLVGDFLELCVREEAGRELEGRFLAEYWLVGERRAGGFARLEAFIYLKYIKESYAI